MVQKGIGTKSGQSKDKVPPRDKVFDTKKMPKMKMCKSRKTRRGETPLKKFRPSTPKNKN